MASVCGVLSDQFKEVQRRVEFQPESDRDQNVGVMSAPPLRPRGLFPNGTHANRSSSCAQRVFTRPEAAASDGGHRNPNRSELVSRGKTNFLYNMPLIFSVTHLNTVKVSSVAVPAH